MNRLRIGVFCLLVFGAYGITTGIAGQNKTDEMCIPIGSLLLKPPESVEQKRSSIDFPHSGHFGYSCQTCHHTWTGEEKILDCTTSNCHDLKQPPKKAVSSDLAVRYYKKAFHARCQGCHKEIKKKNKEMEKLYKLADPKLMKTGPTGCVECHPK